MRRDGSSSGPSDMTDGAVSPGTGIRRAPSTLIEAICRLSCPSATSSPPDHSKIPKTMRTGKGRRRKAQHMCCKMLQPELCMAADTYRCLSDLSFGRQVVILMTAFGSLASCLDPTRKSVATWLPTMVVRVLRSSSFVDRKFFSAASRPLIHQADKLTLVTPMYTPMSPFHEPSRRWSSALLSLTFIYDSLGFHSGCLSKVMAISAPTEARSAKRLMSTFRSVATSVRILPKRASRESAPTRNRQSSPRDQ